MPIIPTSNETTADKAAKFASEINKLPVELCNNELSPASIDEFFVQADGTSLLNGGFQSIPGRRAFENAYAARFKNTFCSSPEFLYFGINGLLAKLNVKVFKGDSLGSIGRSTPKAYFKPPSHGTSAKVNNMSSKPLARETLSPELSKIPNNVMGLFKKSEYEAMYAISSLLTLSLLEGTFDFTEDAKLWAAKMDFFQRALFTLVKDVTELITEHTDTKDTWAKLLHAQFLAT